MAQDNSLEDDEAAIDPAAGTRYQLALQVLLGEKRFGHADDRSCHEDFQIYKEPTQPHDTDIIYLIIPVNYRALCFSTTAAGRDILFRMPCPRTQVDFQAFTPPLTASHFLETARIFRKALESIDEKLAV